MKDFFCLAEKNTSVKTEVVAGFTTFFTMAYIIFVNPNMLGETGMSWHGVFVATCLAAAVGTLVMALFANVPYAIAPGMGLNALFTYTICMAGGFAWQEALAMVFICGLINIIITVTKLRKSIVKSIPEGLQNAIGGGIGLFIAYLGMNNAGLISFTGAYPSVTPGMQPFNAPHLVLAVIGLLIIVVLMVMKVRGAMLIGIIATTIIGIPMGVTQIPETIFSGSETVYAGGSADSTNVTGCGLQVIDGGTAVGSIAAMYVLILLLALVVKYLTRNEKLAWGVGACLLAFTLIACFVDASVFEGLLPAVMAELSLFERFYVFVNGVFDWTAVVYYASVIVFFLFLTVQSMEKRRYN